MSLTGTVHALRKSVIVLLALPGAGLCADGNYAAARRDMILSINETVAEARAHTGMASLDKQVMQAMTHVPRHEFVPPPMRRFAYHNRALPIGAEQTISQPYIVALMTHLAAVHADAVVLEVGTGSGYQAAVLAQLVRHVYTIEIIESLGKRAQSTLARLGYDNVSVKIGDGYQGWEEHAPYDAIIVTAAPEQVPQALLRQLRTGARLVIPVGAQHRVQSLQVLEKQPGGGIKIRDVLPVLFVPLVHEMEEHGTE